MIQTTRKTSTAARGSLKSLAGLVCAGLAAFSMLACGDSPTDAGLTLAEINLEITPDPITAQPSANAEYTWTATFTLTMTESAGTGATINTVTAILNESGDGSGGNEGVASLWEVDSTSNRIEGSSSKTITFTVDYTLLGGGRDAQVVIDLEVTDDNGLELSGSAQATIL